MSAVSKLTRRQVGERVAQSRRGRIRHRPVPATRQRAHEALATKYVVEHEMRGNICADWQGD